MSTSFRIQLISAATATLGDASGSAPISPNNAEMTPTNTAPPP
ncbi:hypothetical protein ACUW8P_001196 [Corynebacterium afermentans]